MIDIGALLFIGVAVGFVLGLVVMWLFRHSTGAVFWLGVAAGFVPGAIVMWLVLLWRYCR